MSTPSVSPARRLHGDAVPAAKPTRVRARNAAFTRRVRRAFLKLLMERQEATTDDLRAFIKVPPEVAHWGLGRAVAGLVAARIIRPVELVTSRRRERHACLIRRWTLAVDHDKVRAWLDAHPELPEPIPVDSAVQP